MDSSSAGSEPSVNKPDPPAAAAPVVVAAAAAAPVKPFRKIRFYVGGGRMSSRSPPEKKKKPRRSISDPEAKAKSQEEEPLVNKPDPAPAAALPVKPFRKIRFYVGGRRMSSRSPPEKKKKPRRSISDPEAKAKSQEEVKRKWEEEDLHMFYIIANLFGGILDVSSGVLYGALFIHHKYHKTSFYFTKKDVKDQLKVAKHIAKRGEGGGCKGGGEASKKK